MAAFGAQVRDRGAGTVGSLPFPGFDS